MQIICLQENLKQALNATERIIGQHLTLPILKNLLLATEGSRLKVSSTNLEIGINSWIPGKIEKTGSITVPAKLISEFVSNLPNKKIQLKTKDKNLELKCDKYKATLRGLSAEDFPIIPKIQGRSLIKIGGSVLKNGFSQVVEMTSFSESRPEISGVLVRFDRDSIKLVATDSFRLAEKSLDLNSSSIKDQAIILPQRTVQELVRILGEKDMEVSLVLAGNQILFDLDSIQIISRLIEGQYPDYQQLIPSKTQTQVVANRNEMINNIKVASLFSGKVNDVKMVVDPKKSDLEIFSKDVDIGEHRSKIEAKIEGEAVEVVFNHRYLLDGLNNIFSDKVVLGINNNASPAILRPVGDTSYTYVVMPIRA